MEGVEGWGGIKEGDPGSVWCFSVSCDCLQMLVEGKGISPEEV